MASPTAELSEKKSEVVRASSSSSIHDQMLESHFMSRSETERALMRAAWSPFRRLCADVAESKRFEFFLSLCIGFNFVLMVVETDQNAACAGVPDYEECSAEEWVSIVNNLLLGFYTVECLVKLFAFRKAFFNHRWNNMDFAIVLMGLFDVFISAIAGDVVPNLSMLRMFRIARLVRAVRILTTFRELYIMVHGFASAMAAMFWGFVMMCLLLTVWSILAVELIHEENSGIDHGDPTCRQVFSSVMMSNLMFFQTVVAGDSWGTCAVPIIKSMPVVFPLFAGVLFTVQIGFTNLILAVIVEQAAQAREADQVTKHQEQKKLEKESRSTLLKLCADIDMNSNGELTLKELQEGFLLDPAFAMHLQLLGIEYDMLAEVFQIMDHDQSGALSYEEFIDTIHRSRTQDIKMLVTMVKFELFTELTKLREDLERSIISNSPKGKSTAMLASDDCAETPPTTRPRSSRGMPTYCVPMAAAAPLTSSAAIAQPAVAESPRDPYAVRTSTASLPQAVRPFTAATTRSESAKQQEDLKLFLETIRIQMSHILDSVTSKVGEQTTGEEKSKLDSLAYGGGKAAFLPPTFTPDGQWQLVLKPDWQQLRSSSVPRTAAAGPEAKDPSASFAVGASEVIGSAAGQWQMLPERPPRQTPPPPRTTPLPSTHSNAAMAYTCDPMIACHQRMETIHVSSRGLPNHSLESSPNIIDVARPDNADMRGHRQGAPGPSNAI